MPSHPHFEDAPPGLWHRLRQAVRGFGHAPARPEIPVHAEVCPPPRWGQAESVWSSLWGWLRDEQAPAPQHRRTIDDARADFEAAMADIYTDAANGLRKRVELARSLRELWHLRAELYGVIACQRSQVEAEKRLDLVNRHFPAGARDAGSRHARTHVV